MIIIFAGAIGRQCGLGGSAWTNMQYLAGLHDLGHEVVYLEDCGEDSWVYNWDTEDFTIDLKYPAEYVRICLESLGLQDKWIYRGGDRSEGMAIEDFLEICSQADLLIVRAISIPVWRIEYDQPQRRIFIDVDPGFTQFKLAKGDPELVGTVDRCERLFTIGQRIGATGCPIPVNDRQWLKTVPPVSLPHWPLAKDKIATHFTAIMRWRGLRDDVFKGVFYGQKDKEFPKFLELPRLTTQPFLIAHIGASSKLLEEYGWKTLPGWVPASTPWSYREFIQNSRAEFSVAKHGYFAMRSGWFSDRSVCYLASGRPTLVQDTGISDWLPTGKGVLTFYDLSEALEGIKAINADYEQHCLAARQIAEQYFATDRILPPMLEAAMN